MTGWITGVRLLLAGAFLFVLANCSTTVPASYTPQSFTEIGDGQIAIGEFSYAPMEGGSIAANPLQNTAIGSIYICTNCADFVKRARALELGRSGLRVSDNAHYRVDGIVEELKLDDLGYSVDWTYRVRYTLGRPSDRSAVLDEVYSVGPIRTGKFGLPSDYSPSLNELVLEGIEKFMQDIRAAGVFLGSGTGPIEEAAPVS